MVLASLCLDAAIVGGLAPRSRGRAASPAEGRPGRLRGAWLAFPAFARLRLAGRPSGLRFDFALLRLAARPSGLRFDFALLRLAARPSGLRLPIRFLPSNLLAAALPEEGAKVRCVTI